MKNIITVLILVFSLCSCYDLLNEVPKDFLTPENSYVDKKGFESALTSLYLSIRDDFYATTDDKSNYDLMGIDVDMAIWQVNNKGYNSYFNWNTMNPDNGFSKKWWQRFYAYIYSCNTIIDRANANVVNWTSENEKNSIVGEAKFLRAYAYHFLANMWGQAPLVLKETTSPQFNYKSVSQDELYKQCKEDLLFAIQWMPDINEQKGGKASKVAAQHLLSEVLIGLKDYQGAIDQATAAITHPAMGLMKKRFGQYADFKFEGYDYIGEKEPWGDVFWDLFQEGNFNRIEGNKETIWNVQFDVKLEGGGNVGTSGGYFTMERWWGSDWWRLKDKDGITNWLKDILCGRPVGDVQPTDYISNQVWTFKDDADRDMRNSQYNMKRKYYWTNPNSRFYGQLMTQENLGSKEDLFKISQPTCMKAVATKHHGQFKDSNSGEGHDNGRIYKDWYIMRLAETYLLRAEAYLLMNRKDEAADDINVLRERAHATLVQSADVNIDLILDERARELYMEEYRINTLMRMNKLTEYLMKYNPKLILDKVVLDNHLNKLPIPSSEIEANKGGGLIQNPGYNN